MGAGAIQVEAMAAVQAVTTMSRDFSGRVMKSARHPHGET